MIASYAVAIVAAAALYPCSAFHSINSSLLSYKSLSNVRSASGFNKAPSSFSCFSLLMTSKNQSEKTAPPSKQQLPSLDTSIAQQFTIQVCTSTSCTKLLKNLGLDRYHVLGEIYSKAQSAKVESCMVIEDGGCQGGKNCKLGPCVAVLHDDFVGNVALEGMGSNEFRERVFHNVVTQDSVDRVWGSVENAICLMSEESNNEGDSGAECSG